MTRSLSWVCLAVVVFVVHISLAAQQLPSWQVVIFNSSARPIKFSISCDGAKSWKIVTLAGNANDRYGCDQRGQRMRIRLVTDLAEPEHNVVEYSVEPGNRYRVIWNKAKHEWELRRIKPRP